MTDALIKRHDTGGQEWRTPDKYLSAIYETLGGTIDLDPASCEEANGYIKAKHIYTKAEDGLKQAWFGNVYCFAPWGRTKGISNQELWMQKAAQEYTAGRASQIISLVNVATDTGWFNHFCVPYTFCTIIGRIRCEPLGRKRDTKRDHPTHGCTFVYMGPNPNLFARCFHSFGPIWHGVHVYYE